GSEAIQAVHEVPNALHGVAGLGVMHSCKDVCILAVVTQPHSSPGSPPRLFLCPSGSTGPRRGEGKDRRTSLLLISCSLILLCGLAPCPLAWHGDLLFV